MTCDTCSIPLYSSGSPVDGARRHQGRGLCSRCYDRTVRPNRRTVKAPETTPPFVAPPDAPCTDDPMLWDGEYYGAIVAAMRGCKECPALTECAMNARGLRLETGVAGGRPWGESIDKYRRGEQQAAQERREHAARYFPCGHDRDAENSAPAGRGARCRTCLREYDAARRAAR